MTLADSNIWLALSLSGHEHHATVSSWLREQQGAERLAFCRLTQASLLRLLTTRAVLNPYGNPPLTNVQAWQLYNDLLADRRIFFAEEPPGLERQWEKLASVPSSLPKLWMDAYLAAFAMAGNYRLVTIDAAFKQFQGLDVIVLQ